MVSLNESVDLLPQKGVSMKSITLRIDESLLETITRNAEVQKIKLSRYIRMLIEKGLVIDSQIQSGFDKNTAGFSNNSKGIFEIRMAQIQAEELLICREILKNILQSESDFNRKSAEASEKAKAFVAKALSADSDIS